MPSCSTTFLVAFNVSLLLLLLGCFFERSNALVVPQELPSILSLVYSNIPPIKKGTDSRLGFGFRLGEHADFQVLVELGPQKETRPLGDKEASDSTFNKRQVSKAQQNYLLRQQLQEELSSTERTAPSWLENWSKNMQANTQSSNSNKKKTKPKAHNSAKKQQEKFAGQQLPTAPMVPQQSLRQLQLLYQLATTSSPSESNTAVEIVTPSSTSTTTIAPLLNLVRTTPPPFKGGRLNLGAPAGFTPRPTEETLLQSMLDLRSAMQQKSKSEITKELMDVSLEDGV